MLYTKELPSAFAKYLLATAYGPRRTKVFLCVPIQYVLAVSVLCVHLLCMYSVCVRACVCVCVICGKLCVDMCMCTRNCMHMFGVSAHCAVDMCVPDMCNTYFHQAQQK